MCGRVVRCALFLFFLHVRVYAHVVHYVREQFYNVLYMYVTFTCPIVFCH